MATKSAYTIFAVIGIAAASGAAWWYQNKAPAELSSPSTSMTTPATRQVGAGPAGGPPRPVSVESAKVEIMKVTDETQSVGSLKSRQGVTIRPEVSGRITQLNFKDGERVKKGQLLVQFDDQLPLAQVKQSQAELSIAMANHKRNQELVAQNFISKRTVDESAANVEVAQAKLALSQATAARLKIVAPFDGMTGIRTVNVGDYLKDGGDIVNIEDITAVFVDFRLPERFQSKIKKGQTAQVDMDALPGRKFTAIVQAIDPLLDANGRSVGVRACIDNRQNQLRPGMFARVNTVFSERDKALVIPEEAIVPQGGKQYVIKLLENADKGADKGSDKDRETKTTQRVEVKIGIRKPGKVEILEGLAEGDEVVTAGQLRVQKDGTSVKVIELGKSERADKFAKPTASTAPTSPATPATPDTRATSAAPAAPNSSVPVMPENKEKMSAAVVNINPIAIKNITKPIAQKPPQGPNPCTEMGSKSGDKTAGKGSPRENSKGSPNANR